MKHLQTISRMPQPAQDGNFSIAENIIVVLMSIFFQGWDNFNAAISGLRKFYQKTPD
jgi:hypothetical protein